MALGSTNHSSNFFKSRFAHVILFDLICVFVCLSVCLSVCMCVLHAYLPDIVIETFLHLSTWKNSRRAINTAACFSKLKEKKTRRKKIVMKARTASDGCGGADDSCMFMTLGPSISRRIMIPCGERKKYDMPAGLHFFFACCMLLALLLFG